MTQPEKIEFACIRCQAVLRLGVEHGGKQARCPNCQGIVPVPLPPPVWTVPVESKESATIQNSGSDLPPPPFVNPQQTAQQWAPPPPPSANNPYAYTGQTPPLSPFRPPPSSSAQDHRVTSALVMGILSICSNVLCFCGVPFGIVLSAGGLVLAMTAPAERRTPALIVNLVGMGISGLMLVILIIGLVFD